MVIFATKGNKELTKFVTALGTLSGKVKTHLFPTKRQISTDNNPIIIATNKPS